MKLDYPKIMDDPPVWETLTRDQRKAITVIPTAVRSFTLERVLFRELWSDEMQCHLIYKSSLCGVPDLTVNKWLYHPEVHMSTKMDPHVEGYHKITWVILELTHEQDGAHEALDSIPALQRYKRHTIKGYVQAVDKMARLLGWVQEVKPRL